MHDVTFGVIVGNRGFFPAHLCETGRESILKVLKKNGHRAVLVDAQATRSGAIESLAEARLCGDLFKKHAEEIDGIIVTLPNFGDERAVANAIRFSGLDVPVLVHAFADDPKKMSIQFRRDSFCGKMSACNNLRQYGIRYSLTRRHTIDPNDPIFAEDLERFAGICRVVRSLKKVRIGMLGSRPTAFNTVRFSEKLLERFGISVETLDLSEILGRVAKMSDGDKEVKAKLAAIKKYTRTEGIAPEGLARMAKLGAAIDRWIAEQELSATAIQCWTSLEEFYGVVPCTLMSMMSNTLMPCACETDIVGLLGMYILQQASGRPSAILDWNNNYGTDPDKGVVFHCSNLPADFFAEHRMDYQEIIAGTVGKANTYGTLVGRIKTGPFTYCRISTDDLNGKVCGYVGQGDFTDDKLDTFGGYGVVKIPEFQKLLSVICEKGFEHHVAANHARVADAVEEALVKYKGWDIYRHVG